MNVLVTGGAGFIGSHVVDCLIEEGFRVSVVDNLVRGVVSNVNPRAGFHKMDVLDPTLWMLFEHARFDYVIHLASQIDVRQSWADPVADAQTNVIGFLRVLDCCRRYKIKGVILASSGGAVYAESDGTSVTETAAEGPISPYGVSKLASEYYLSQFSFASGVPSVSLRFANVYGPRQDTSGEAGVVAVFVERMLAGTETVIYGDGKQVRDFVYVADVAQSVLKALDYLGGKSRNSTVEYQDPDSMAFNIGAGHGTTVTDLWNLCAEVTRYGGVRRFEPARPGEIRWSCLSPEKAAAVLGWRAKTDLTLGVAMTAEWIRAKLRQDAR